MGRHSRPEDAAPDHGHPYSPPIVDRDEYVEYFEYPDDRFYDDPAIYTAVAGPEQRVAASEIIDELPASPPTDDEPTEAAGRSAEAGNGRRKLGKAAKRTIGVAAIAGVAALTIGTWTGEDGPKEVPRGPNILDTAAPVGTLTGPQLVESARNKLQGNINNGENGKRVTVAPGILTVDTPDGARVSYANPMIAVEGLPAQVKGQFEAGTFDLSVLDGRVFATGAAHNTPLPGQPRNFDRGIIAVDVTGADAHAHFTPVPGAGIVEVPMNWNSESSVGVDQSGTPLEINTKTGEVAQHAVGGDWQTLAIGVQVASQSHTDNTTHG